MKKMGFIIICLFIFSSASFGKTTRINISADLIQNKQKARVFDGDLIVPEGGQRDIFTGPYTARIALKENESGFYDFTVNLFGLAPEYNSSEYNFALRTTENMIMPALPVKDGTKVNFKVTLLDDASSSFAGKYSVDDTANWGTSETTHYRTHWVKSSLIDFTWNREMAYLEFVYDKYRESYKLSEFDKIETYIHPEKTNEIYLDRQYNYSILPKSRRIDLVYGHDIKALSPVPGCEILMYRQWGYGPRWMAAGLANYYNDNMLMIRKFIARFDANSALELLKNEDRVRNDTGSVFCGAFVFWLLQNESFAEFKKLYKQSTVLDFERKFEDVYRYSFQEVLQRFLDHAQNYTPIKSELDYYASFYFNHDNMVKAGTYYKEMIISGEGNRIANLKKLATCYFWTGGYNAADTLYDLLIGLNDSSAEAHFMKGEVQLSKGNVALARQFFEKSLEKGFSSAGLKLVSLLVEDGEFEKASKTMDRLGEGAKGLIDYSLEKGRLILFRGDNADSLLDITIRRAINISNKSSHDPRAYVVMGKAHILLGDREKAINNFETAYFLETSPYNQSSILIEMGKTEDLLGDREKAKMYYLRAKDYNGGNYFKMLAEKYLDSPYRWKK